MSQLSNSAHRKGRRQGSECLSISYLRFCLSLAWWSALALNLSVSALASPPTASGNEIVTTHASDRTRVYTTAHFAIEHTMSGDWAAELGDRLEALARQFPAAAAKLGVTAAAGRGVEALRWRCVAEPGAFSGTDVPLLSANYDARLNEVTLRWTPEARGSYSPTSSGFAPDVPFLDGVQSPTFAIRVSHELVHQLAFDSGLQARDVMYPLWVAEGLASNFESPGERLQYLGPNPERHARLVRLTRNGDLLPLANLVVITDRRGLSRSKRVDAYAQAWGFFRFLAETRDEQLKHYLQTLAALPPGPRAAHDLRRELERSFGRIERVEQDWEDWLAALVASDS